MIDFANSQDAFEYWYDFIIKNGEDRGDHLSLFNVGFYLMNPMSNKIQTDFRKWKESYAKKEWEWYLSADPNASEIAKHAKIWLSCMDEKGEVNSNYGSHWFKHGQIDFLVKELKKPNSRRASVSVFNSKERHNFENDTPCTYAAHFYVLDSLLCMSVMMRSNDLWYGFCNDQYCFSKFQEMIAFRCGLQVGNYYHFANNLHLYKRNIQ